MHPQLFKLSGANYFYAIGAIAAIAAAWSVWAVRRRRASELLPGVIIAALFCAVLLVLWKIGRPLPIWSYGVFLMLAFAAGIAWAVREARIRGLDADVVLDLAFFVLVGSIIGARLLHVILEFEYYRLHPGAIWSEWGWGLSFHGGLLGGMLAGLLFSRSRRLSFGTLADIAAPSIALGYAIARVGCFLRGCCYGAPTNLPWGCRFLLDPTADPHHPGVGVWTAPSHPTQLYAAAASLAIFGLLLWLRGRLRARGQLFLAYLALYSAARWGVEILRRGYSAQSIGADAWLTEAQVASMIILVIALAGIRLLARREARAASHESKRGHPQTSRARRRRTSR